MATALRVELALVLIHSIACTGITLPIGWCSLSSKTVEPHNLVLKSAVPDNLVAELNVLFVLYPSHRFTPLPFQTLFSRRMIFYVSILNNSLMGMLIWAMLARISTVISHRLVRVLFTFAMYFMLVSVRKEIRVSWTKIEPPRSA